MNNNKYIIPSDEQLQNSRLHVEVSCFKNYFSTESKSVLLTKWLTSDQHASKQNEIRQLQAKGDRDKMKAMLPAITPAALLRDRKKTTSDNIISTSGLMCIDIDKKDNLHLMNYDDLLHLLPRINNIIYAGESVSGTGYWLLIPIAYPGKLESHFKAITILFRKHFNIQIDITKGKNLTDLRGYSYTQNPYFNLNAITFAMLYEEELKTTMQYSKKDNRQNYIPKNIPDQIEKLVHEIETKGIDLTINYKYWYEIGMALASIGELGRSYFHRISKINTNYKFDEAEKKFANFLKTYNGKIRINTFFYHCKNAGIITTPY